MLPRHARTARASGFTIVELLITIAIILTISAIAIPNLLSAVNDARIARAVGDVRTIGDQAMGYEVINYQPPPDLATLGYGGNLDPWGHPYQYLSFVGLKGKRAMRKDRFLVPINTYFDLYSMGADGKTAAPLTAQASQDDIIWANDGGYVGLASQF